MDKMEKSFELIAKYAISNRDLINFGIIIGLLAIAFISTSGNSIQVISGNYTQTTNITLSTTQPSSPVLGSIFYNTTSHTTNCYDNGWRYCGNGTLI